MAGSLTTVQCDIQTRHAIVYPPVICHIMAANTAGKKKITNRTNMAMSVCLVK